MRGILLYNLRRYPDIRITPAHAGNTLKDLKTFHNPGDHPRTCGEYIELSEAQKQLTGSPPHMRGIQLLQ